MTLAAPNSITVAVPNRANSRSAVVKAPSSRTTTVTIVAPAKVLRLDPGERLQRQQLPRDHETQRDRHERDHGNLLYAAQQNVPPNLRPDHIARVQ